MKKLFNMVLAVASVFAAASCIRELNTGIPQDAVSGEKVRMTFSASIGDDTKATLVDGTEIWWEPGDMILINGDPFYAATKVPSKTTDFVGETVPTDEYYAISSESVMDAVWTNASYEIGISGDQVASDGQLPTYISVAKCSHGDNKLNFINLLGYVKFTLPEELADISMFIVSSNADEVLSAARTRVDFSGKKPALTLCELKDKEWRSSYVTFYNLGGYPGVYYVAMYPGIYSDGLTFTFRKDDGREARKSINQEITLQPGFVQDIGTIKNLPEFTDPDDEIRAALIRFYNATGGEKWINNDGWCSDLPWTQWYGISYGTGGSGISEINISLPYNNLKGKITPEVFAGFRPSLALSIYGNSISEIDFAPGSNLRQLHCSDNPIKRLDIAGSSKLVDLWCSTSPLSELVLDGCVALQSLECGETNIASLDLSDNANLRHLGCYDTFLETIDLSMCTKLESFSCYSNREDYGIRELDVSNLGNLRQLHCDSRFLASLDVSRNPNLEVLWCCVDALAELDVTNNPKLTSLNCGRQLDEPDDLPESMPRITSIDLSNNPELEHFCITSKGITYLDLSNNPKLRSIWVGHCRLPSLDLSNNPALEELRCNNNVLTSLNISANSRLSTLVCQSNNISQLDVTANFGLRELYCAKNNLTELDVTACPSLEVLETWSNPDLASIYALTTQNFTCQKDSWTKIVYKDGVDPDKPDDKEYYESVDYSQDGQAVTIQRASVGAGIDIVLMGDGYSDRLIADRTYDDVMHRTMEVFFAEEPYKSFRNYFNVHYVTVVSQNEVFDDGASTALGASFGDGTAIEGDLDKVLEYSMNVLDVDEMDDATVVVVLNSANYAGSCYMYMYNELAGDHANGLTVSFCPTAEDNVTFATIVQHEAGGHGFGKLGDEYAGMFAGKIPDWEIDGLVTMEAYGWYRNVDYVNDVNLVKWSHFLADERYSDEGLDIYEGAYTYAFGVYRPSWESIMRQNTGGFNAPSREAIYYRIHKLAYGPQWEYDYEEFVEYDAVNRVAATKSARKNYVEKDDFVPLAPPVIIKGDWRDGLR